MAMDRACQQCLGSQSSPFLAQMCTTASKGPDPVLCKARDIDRPQSTLQRGTGSMAALQLQYSGNNLPPLALVPGAAPVVMGRSKDATAGGLVDPFVSRKHASFAWASEDSVALTAHSKVHVVVRGALDAVPVDAGTTTTASPSNTLNFS